MTVVALLTYLHKQGVALWVEDERLRYSAPKGVLTPALRAELIEKKAEIIEFLQNSIVTVQPSPELPMPTTRREEDLPLSVAQQGLWFLHQLAPDDSSYNIPVAIRLCGLLNVQALARSLEEIVRRHEALRTTVSFMKGQPVQIIAPVLAVPLPVRDLSALPVSRRKAESQLQNSQEGRQPFDLTRGPLIRATLFRLDAEEHMLLLCLQHIVFDGWSMGVLVRELASLYEAFATGKLSPLPELPLQYADYVTWQRQWLEGEAAETHLSYWQQQLTGMPPVFELPSDRPRPAVRTSREAHYISKLSRALTAGLKALSQREGATLFMTLLAAFQTLLYRYSGQEDLVVGILMANRAQAEFEGLIGCFVNTLVLRTELAGNLTFRELLRRVREVTLAAYDHQELPFERLVEAMVPERNTSYAPLVQVKFALQNAPMPAWEVAGLTLSQLEVEDETNRSGLNISMVEDLMLSIGEVEGELTALLNYNMDLFDATTISRMMGHLKVLLERVVADPERPLSTLPILTGDERRQMLIEWNETAAPYPANRCIHHLFEFQAQCTPDAVALVFEDKQLSYHELNQRANRVAHRLQKCGVGPDKLVGVILERSLEAVVGILGILKSGGAFVPLDPAYPEERLAFMLQDAQVSILLTQQRLLERLPEHNTVIICLDADWKTMAEESIVNPISEASSDNLAYVIYTSGSTGKPKGVMVVHRGVCNLAEAQRQVFDLHPGDRILQFASLSFDASIWEIVMALLAGAALCLAAQDNLLPGPAFMDLLQEYAITCITLPPSALSTLAMMEFPLLHTVVAAGEACSSELVKGWGKGRRFFNAYGPTETTVCATIALCSSDTGTVSIGRPLANTQIYLLDTHLQAVPIGSAGELYVGGYGLALGYLNRPELTSERFIAHPFSDAAGARLYKTGDLARYRSNGTIEFLGRIDSQVKVRGYRIELGEVEAALKNHPAVREAIIVVREDATGDARLVAYVGSSSHEKPTAGDLRSFLSSKLPAYMIPVSFIVLETLPLTPNGKVDRQRLSRFEEGAAQAAVTYVPPQTATEQIIAKIWQEVLDVERVGVHDNFFDLGGHSLLLGRVHNNLRTILDKDVSMIDLFTYPTISTLIEYINQRQDEEETFQQSYERAEARRTSMQRQRQTRQTSAILEEERGVQDE